MEDTVAERSRFLCTYMSSHPDTLVAYTKHFGKVKGNVSSAAMLSIDSKGMDLEYKIKGSTGKPQVVRVEFDPPLHSYDEVKPRLLSMKADADEALGTVKAPQITHFETPFQIWTTGSLLLILLYTTSIPPNSTSSFWSLAHFLHSNFSDTFFNAVWAFVGIVHLGEAAYATRLARKHSMPWHAAMGWISLTAMFGMPVLLRLRHVIKQARIESIMKGQ